MANILQKIIDHKLQEIEAAKQATPLAQLQDQISDAPPVRGFLQAINASSEISLIAEVKKASPSKGIIREDFDPLVTAEAYQAAGATCISVLTDEHFFQGRLEYLTAIRQRVELPLLRKDFIVDPYQVFEARVAGADAVLLIAECLTADQLQELHDQIVALEMTPLVELYREDNLTAVLDCGAKLIGVNNRNLETFETDLNHCMKMRKAIPEERTVVGESGIFTPADVQLLRNANIDAMLVGESLMREPDISQAVRNLLSST